MPWDLPNKKGVDRLPLMVLSRIGVASYYRFRFPEALTSSPFSGATTGAGAISGFDSRARSKAGRVLPDAEDIDTDWSFSS